MKKPHSIRLSLNSKKVSFPAEDVWIFDRASPASLPCIQYGLGPDPWFGRPFDRLTVLSKVEGESRKMAGIKSFWTSRPLGRGMTNYVTARTHVVTSLKGDFW